MGIKDLITKNIKALFPEVVMEMFADSVVAVDVSIYMCKSKAVRSEKGIMYYFRSMVQRFASLRIFPIFVFDGERSSLKGMTSEKRQNESKRKREIVDAIRTSRIETPEEKGKLITALRELGNQKAQMLSPDTKNELFMAQIVDIRDGYIREINTIPTDEEKDQLYYYLQLMGFTCIIVNGHESESFCAYLNKIGVVDFVMSEDSDCLVWGAKQVVCGYSNAGGKFVSLRKRDILMQSLGFTTDMQLVNYGILLGTDYNARAHGNGPVRARKLIHEATDDGCKITAFYTGEDLYKRIVDDINHEYKDELAEVVGEGGVDKFLESTVEDLFKHQQEIRTKNQEVLFQDYLEFM